MRFIKLAIPIAVLACLAGCTDGHGKAPIQAIAARTAKPAPVILAHGTPAAPAPGA